MAKMLEINILEQAEEQWLERKRLGAFYTPRELSDLLCDWAIRDANDLVLEPSFGGCGFLESATTSLKKLGVHIPMKQIYGCDIDSTAFQHLSEKFQQPVDLDHFLETDFLTFDEHKSWPGRFHVVVGNPPYLSYHHIDSSARDLAVDRLASIGFDIPKKSSTWAYFVALSLRFLRKGGRIAWVLPGSFLQSNYAEPLRRYLSSRFERIQAFHIRERLFLYEGTDEQTVVLLGENFSPDQVATKAATDIGLSMCKDLSEFEKLIISWKTSKFRSEQTCKTFAKDGLPSDAAFHFDELAMSAACISLADIAEVRIGLVTGANSFFLLSPSQVQENGLLEDDYSHVIGKFIDASGLTYCADDIRSNLNKDRRCLLISTETPETCNKKLKEYLKTFSDDLKKANSTFKKRRIWTRTNDNRVPDAFFPVMHHQGPKLVLNTRRVNCTNTVHRVYFSKPVSVSYKKLVCISALSTFSQVSAELEGRQYGSGVLKHEPREAERVRLLLPADVSTDRISTCFKQIDMLLRRGNHKDARQTADAFLASEMSAVLSPNAIKTLENGLQRLRSLRHPGNRSKSQ